MILGLLAAVCTATWIGFILFKLWDLYLVELSVKVVQGASWEDKWSLDRKPDSVHCLPTSLSDFLLLIQ